MKEFRDLDSLIAADEPERDGRYRSGRPRGISTKHKTREQRLATLTADFQGAREESANKSGRWWIDGTWNLFQPRRKA